LRGQIQPHFIFNTLSALQHWVDTGDVRAPALLRSLTAFLRGSTELLGRGETTLQEEVSMVGHYLAIQHARLGERLAHSIDIAPPVANEKLPPGLLLTLVENAVEHGISPSLGGGTVRVSAEATADGWRVCVRDDGAGLVAGWREGVGLANCRQRLHHHFGARAALQLTPQRPGAEACVSVERAAA
jgi:LytS/YehU family sensor histidine kinase